MSTSNLKSKLNGKLQPNQTETADDNAVNTPSAATALATVNHSSFVALTSDALGIINENLKNQPLSYSLFDIVKSPSGGTTAFTVPGLAGDEIQKELTGIILDYTTPRAYWDTPDPVEGTPPICFSKDSIVSHEGKPCNRCQFNDFGSKNGDSLAKACKEQVQILLLRPDNIMPVIVRVPVSSKLLFQKYMTRLIGRMIPLSGVVTKITLEKTTNKTGQPFALYNFEAVKQITPEEAANAKAFGQKFVETLNADEEPVIAEAV
jgi:hypothetical protein